jgi:hypothetical protein
MKEDQFDAEFDFVSHFDALREASKIQRDHPDQVLFVRGATLVLCSLTTDRLIDMGFRLMSSSKPHSMLN